MTLFTPDQWLIVALVFVLGLVLGMALMAGGKWKRRYREERARADGLEAENRRPSEGIRRDGHASPRRGPGRGAAADGRAGPALGPTSPRRPSAMPPSRSP